MSKKEVVFIAFSDLHINLWAKFNENNSRTLNNIKVLDVIAGQCEKYRCPALFCGDMFHKPESIDQDLAVFVRRNFERISNIYPKFRMLYINGNHDLKLVNRINDIKQGWPYVFYEKFMVCLDCSKYKWSSYDDYHIYGVPYIDNNVGISEYLKKLNLDKNVKNILLLHTDYPGAKDTDGREIGSVENLNVNTLNRFDLVLCGHIHKPQRLSKKVYMIGAPLHQRRTDKDCQLGYWKVYSDLSMKFVPLRQFPKFVDVESEEGIKDDGNYYTIIPKKTSNLVNTNHKITKQLSKKALAKRYLKEKGITEQEKKALLIDILKKTESC